MKHIVISYSILSCSCLELTDFEKLMWGVTNDDTIVAIATNITFNSTIVISGVAGLELKSNTSRGLHEQNRIASMTLGAWDDIP